MSKWNDLLKTEKKKHKLSSCEECRDRSYHLQQTFPLHPLFSPPTPALEISRDLHHTEERKLAQLVVRELNQTFKKNFGHSFVDSVITHCKDEQVERKKGKSQARKERRSLLRKCRDQVTQQMEMNAALFTLAEDESLSKYQRKRKSQSFETPSSPKKLKSHSPSSDNIVCDETQLLQDLRNFPTNTKINWSKFAREHGISNKNGGQIVKELAANDGIEVLKLECKENSPTRRVRACKRKLPGMNSVQ